ncbi:hypothetical protein P3T16_000652 [Paraburkholderia sp. GAS42]
MSVNALYFRSGITLDYAWAGPAANRQGELRRPPSVQYMGLDMLFLVWKG